MNGEKMVFVLASKKKMPMTCRKNERIIDVGDIEQQFTLLLLDRRQKSIVFNDLWGNKIRKQDFRFEEFCNTYIGSLWKFL